MIITNCLNPRDHSFVSAMGILAQAITDRYGLSNNNKHKLSDEIVFIDYTLQAVDTIGNYSK